MRKIAFLFAAILGSAWFVTPSATATQSADSVAYVCPMHPDQTSETPGKCQRCGMALVLGSPYDTRDYHLTLDTVPAVVTPGQPFVIRVTVAHPGTREPVKDFEVVHDKRYHLFIVGRDMEVFQHIHPEQMPDGSWTVSTTLPKAGAYLVISDFLPARGSSQAITRPLITAGARLDLDAPARTDDVNTTTRTVDGMTATVTYQPSRFWAEVTSDITFTLRESATGAPVTDLQPYLGSLGHAFVMSEDALDYVHAHPALSADADVSSQPRGPSLTFDVFMPRPGRYRAWAQFQRHDKIYTFPFTFTVFDPLGGPR